MLEWPKNDKHYKNNTGSEECNDFARYTADNRLDAHMLKTDESYPDSPYYERNHCNKDNQVNSPPNEESSEKPSESN